MSEVMTRIELGGVPGKHSENSPSISRKRGRSRSRKTIPGFEKFMISSKRRGHTYI
jgi:hypothetical protein